MELLDLTAPIIPGVSAAGISLGCAIESVLTIKEAFDRQPVLDYRQRPSGITRYTSSSVDLWEHAGVIDQIMVHGAYRGQILGRLGLGATIADVERVFGNWQEDEEDNLVIGSLPGLWFEIEGCFPSVDDPAIQSASICTIGVCVKSS
jgi:hypothetical protein